MRLSDAEEMSHEKLKDADVTDSTARVIKLLKTQRPAYDAGEAEGMAAWEARWAWEFP